MASEQLDKLEGPIKKRFKKSSYFSDEEEPCDD